jgi:hypothetical protein
VKTYLDLPMQLDVSVKQISDDKEVVTLYQLRHVNDATGEDETDQVNIHISQVPQVIKALRTFLKDQP